MALIYLLAESYNNREPLKKWLEVSFSTNVIECFANLI